MAWRPLYQPQLGQTVCGIFAAEQRGQLLRATVPILQLLARRLRVFDLDFFFFGTAIGLSALGSVSVGARDGLSRTFSVGPAVGIVAGQVEL
jgi:hypothetical protein